jgi:hypothetical protein
MFAIKAITHKLDWTDKLLKRDRYLILSIFHWEFTVFDDDGSGAAWSMPVDNII